MTDTTILYESHRKQIRYTEGMYSKREGKAISCNTLIMIHSSDGVFMDMLKILGCIRDSVKGSIVVSEKGNLF